MKVSAVVSPVKIAILLAVLLVVWLLIGDKKQALDEPPEAAESTQQVPASVEVKSIAASFVDRVIIAQGQLTPWQAVTVTAQVAGRITAIAKREGSRVQTGEVLLTLSDEGRELELVQAKAMLALREQELASGVKLESSRFLAETERKRLASSLAQAQSDVRARELAVEYGSPKAPFDGVVNQRHTDIGAYVTVGTPLMDVVDIHQLRAKAQIPQQQINEIKEGLKADLQLLDGRKLAGEVSFISVAADSATRTYAVEVTVLNPEHAPMAGASATISIHLPPEKAHRLSPALLHLDDAGQLGVYAVDNNDRVTFHRASHVRVDNDAAMVAGLPDQLRVITLGAGFVELGQQVTAVEVN